MSEGMRTTEGGLRPWSAEWYDQQSRTLGESACRALGFYVIPPTLRLSVVIPVYNEEKTLRVLVDLLSIHYFLRFGTRPGHFFGGLGLLVMGAGTLMLAYLGVLKLMGESIGTRPLMFLGFFCVVGGLQFLTTGVLAELLMQIGRAHV